MDLGLKGKRRNCNRVGIGVSVGVVHWHSPVKGRVFALPPAAKDVWMRLLTKSTEPAVRGTPSQLT